MPVYFTEETEEAINKYNKSQDPFYRNSLYQNEIQPAFNKLVENIIYSFKLTSKYEDYQTLKDKTIGDLVLKIDKFNPNRISKTGKRVKAFSFFGTVAKHFIMMEWKKENKNVSLHDFDHNYDSDEYSCKTNTILNKFSVTDDSLEKNEKIEIIKQYLRDEQELASEKFSIEAKILDAIEYAFERQYDITNKKALFLFLREFTGLTTIEISSFLSKFRPKLREFLKKYNRGEI